MLAWFPGRAQVVSMFTWDSSPVTTASIGPNATSAGATATSSPGGVGGTNGLNPGAPTAANINLTIPNTGNVFDIPNCDIKIDYRRNESTATMVKRTNFTFNVGNSVANFQVSYRVVSGAGFATVTSTAYPIPQDNVFRTYRFTYSNCTGVGTMYVNNTIVWTSPSPTVNTNLYWTGEGSVIVGQDMDGANNNVPNLDNFVYQTFTCTSLPIELADFKGWKEGNHNRFSWVTFSEKNNDYFMLEKSMDAVNWMPIARVQGAGTTSESRYYEAVEASPAPGINYYRLSQVDRDGHTEHFNILSIDNTVTSKVRLERVFDMLGRQVDPESATGPLIEIYSDGSVVKKFIIQAE